jgi:phage tail P2-like protein
MSEIDFISVLPRHSSFLERAIEQAGSLPARQDVPRVWNADTCPVGLLPWLAHALSVEGWSDSLSETVKRAVIRASIDVQRRKGTVYSVKTGLDALGFSINVVEWFGQVPRGDPYTYKAIIEVEEIGFNRRELFLALDTIDANKSLRSHLSEVEFIATSVTSIPVAFFCSTASTVTVVPLELNSAEFIDGGEANSDFVGAISLDGGASDTVEYTYKES